MAENPILNAATPPAAPAHEVYYLSEILGRKVYRGGKKVGKLRDLQIVETGKVPEVTFFYVTRPFGHAGLAIPWEKVSFKDEDEIQLDVEDVEKFVGEPPADAVLLRDHILDKKILDIEDREIEVVYDVRLVLRNTRLYVSDVDLSRYGLLRRVGLKGLANFIYKQAFLTEARSLYTGRMGPVDMIFNMLAHKIKDKTISWAYIQPLPTDISSFKGDVKLNILKDKLEDLPPVDLADVLEEMNREQRLVLFDKLDPEQASDALEEIDPSVQRDIVSSLKKEKVAALIDEMTPGQAADILSVLPWTDVNIILKLLSADNARKVEAILKQGEEKIIHYSTSNVFHFSPEKTVAQAEEEYYRAAKDMDVIMYLYVTGEEDKLLGVIDLKELLQASHEAMLKDIMTTSLVTLSPYSTLKDASDEFTRYGFRAIPITDDAERLLGVVPYRDVMNLKHRFLE